MKTKVLLLALLAQLFTLSASAYDVCVGGIYYNLNLDNMTAEVTYAHNSSYYDVETDYYQGYYRTKYNTFYSGSISIPEKVNGCKVTSIGPSAFHDCAKLTSVTIPSSVTKIGNLAFWGCIKLSSLTIPSSVEFIGHEPWPGNCPWWESFISTQDGLVYINNVLLQYRGTMEENAEIVLREGTVGICTNAFSGRSNMTSIVIPETVTCIGSFAFKGCSSLKSITLPKRLSIMGEYNTFYGCNSLESIEIPAYESNDGYEGDLMFSSCQTLKRATFAEGVTRVGYRAFLDCTKLSYVSLPSTITEIGSRAFEGCDNLTTVKVAMRQPVDITEYVFPNRANATLYVPIGSKAAYEGAAFWRGFKEIIEMEDDTDVSRFENAVYMEKTECIAGSTATLSFKMKNSAAIRGFQFDLYLPEGVTAVKNNKGRIQGALSSGRLSEDDEHTLTLSEQADGAIRFLCGSQYDETFTDNDGEIATLQVTIAENMEDGDYPIILKDMRLSETDITKYYDTERLKFTLTISSYILGDIDGDGTVNVTDYIGIANHILGIPQAVFIEKAGDVDSNGAVDVADYTGVANLIMTGNIYGNSNNAKPESKKVKAKAAAPEENVIYVQQDSLPIGEASNAEVVLSIRMKNTADIRGFQFDMYLPEGFTVVKNNKGRIAAALNPARLSEDDEHTLTVQEQADGAIRFLCSSLYDETFTGNDGEIATLRVKLAGDITSGEYPILLKNMKLTETNISNFYETELVESVFKITGDTPQPQPNADMNGDGKVDIADVICILNIMAQQ